MTTRVKIPVFAKTTNSSRKRTSIAVIAALSMLSAACSSPEEKVEKLYTSGQEFLEKDEIGKANVQFQNVLKIDETHVPTLLALAQIAERRQNLKGMFGLYQRIVRLQPDHIHAHVQLGKLHLIGSDETTALEFADKALALEPGNTEATALKSGVLLRLGDAVGAVKLARAAIAADPTNAEATTVLATARGMEDDFEGAIAELDRALAIDPKIAILQLLRIRILSQLDREEDVLDSYANLTELFPEERAYHRAYASELIKRKELAAAETQLRIVVDIAPEDLDAKLDVVRIVNAQNGIEVAEAQLREYVKAEPDNNDLIFALADLLREQGASDKALPLLQPLTKSDDLSIVSRAKNKLALLYLVNGEPDKAEQLVEEILEEDGNNTEALIKRASFQIEREEYDDAIANLRTAINNEPDSIQAMMLMSSAFERQDNIDFARSELTKAFETSGKRAQVANAYAKFLARHGNSRRAENVLVQSLALFPGNSDNLKLLAALRLDLQDWQGAEEVAAILDTNKAADATDIVRNIRTVAMSGLGDYDRLIEELSPQNNTPMESRPLAMLVRAYVQAERTDEAEAMLKNVLASDGENYAARILLAQTHAAQQDTAAAEAVLIDAVDANPARGEAYELLYRYYLTGGERDKAVALIDNGLAKAPDSDALQFFKADILLTSGELESALDIYSDLIDKRPNDRIVANNFVSLSSDLRQDTQSKARALEVAKVLLDDENPLIQDTVGWAYYRAGQHDRAVEYLAKAAEKAENNSEILYHLGAAQIAAGKSEAGSASLNKALAAGGENFRYETEVRALLEQQ